MGLVLAACGDEGPIGPDHEVAVVEVSPSTDTLFAVGAMAQWQAVARDAEGAPIAGRSFTWTSSTPAVATVSDVGLVTAVSNGSTAIQAETGGVSGSATAIVQQRVSAMTVSPTPVALAVAETVQLSVTASDANGHPVSGVIPTWRSSDTGVATVASDGVVTAVAPGSATITAEADVTSPATVTVLSEELTRLRDLRDDAYVPVLLGHVAQTTADALNTAFAGVDRGLAEGDDASVQSALETAKSVVADGDPSDSVLLAVIDLVLDGLELLLHAHNGL